ncbi:MAG: N-6 DNA methylase, partial [Phototrophicales bacterium]|nr:N-6 DNA methylase [Phototrophicales bacterium]
MTTTLAPITKASAQTIIRDLVQKFRQDRQRDAYNEQQTREYFILPLFRALGWNTENPSEFSAEEQISRGRVDFGFYRHGVPVFYLETKRVSERLENPKFIRQAINYAYLRGVTWAVLCDFEQILVYNAQWDSNDIEKVRFLRLTYTDYAEKDFDDLWLLSKSAFMTNALDRQAEKYGKKAVREPVTQILFRQLTDWRKQLFTEFRTFGGVFATDSARVDNAVQRLIDRLIFIRSMEDRGIEGDTLQSLTRLAKSQKQNLYTQLQTRFGDLDKQYNSNIFAFSDLDHLKFSDMVLLDSIITGLYGNQTTVEYDFNAISADVLGAVYEQYLSFKAQDPHGEQTAKSHKRKSQGIYYTPQFIVRYIVQNTLGEALQNGSDPLKIRVLDPACGSGSFLIEAFDYLDRWITNSHPDMPESARRDHILQHNLYGVDLDEQAVEVTRLNLLLRAAYARRLLPPLTHIRHGDSLIATNFDYHTAFDDVFAAGGFDVVVGNPPYVRQETLGATFKDYVSKHYSVYAGTADLYVYFIERGLSLLKNDGRLGYILPNKWMRANYGKALRTFLDDKKIDRVVDFGDLPVFPDATTYPSLLFLDNAEKSDTFLATNANTYDMKTELTDFVRDNEFSVSRHHLRPDGWSLAKSTGQALLTKLMATGTPLGEYVDGKIYWGIKTGYNEAFVIDESTRQRLIAQDPKSAELIKPRLTGRDIKRYQMPVATKYLIFTRHNTDITKYPAILTHLENFKERLMPRPKDFSGEWLGRKSGKYQWYEIQDQVNYFS